MSQIAEQKCPACGAPLRFDPASGKLVCDYCGTVVDLQQEAEKPSGKPAAGKAGKAKKKPAPSAPGAAPAAPAAPSAQASSAGEEKPAAGSPEDAASVELTQDTMEGFDFANITDLVTDPNAADLPIYNCVSCGAEVIAPAEQMALTCPYCGNNIVLTQKVSGKLRPDGVIPFRIQAKDLPDAVNRFYRGKKLLPRNFFSESTMGKVTGVYVPFWVFTGKLSGRLTYKAQTSSSARHGDYVITKTNYYKLVRDAAMDFERLPVDAGGRFEDRFMDSLEPFDQSQIQPFDMRYLAGFTADRFDQKKTDITERAEKRMRYSALNLIGQKAVSGYGTATRTGGWFHTDLDAKYILFPVYMFDISHAGKNYHFAVNGQTGKVVGDLPDDSGVSSMYFLKRFGLVTGGLILFSVAKYMLGM